MSKDEKPVVVWADGRTPTNLCKAVKKDGQPCKRPPIQGATVCRAHGGASPQVKRKAQQRLLEGVPKMLRMLHKLASDDDIPPAVRLNAIRDWLDRAGIDRKIEIDVSSSTFTELLAGAIVSIDDDALIGNFNDYAHRGFIAGELVEEDDGRRNLPQPAVPDKPYRPTRRR